MSETLAQVLSYINELLPHGVNSTTIVTLINGELRKNWEFLTSTNAYAFNTSSGIEAYALPSDITIDMITGLDVADTTTSTSFAHYEFSALDDELTGYKYYDSLGQLGIHPVPDNTYSAILRHQEYPTLFASSDTGVEFNIDQDYIDYIKFKVMARIAKSGNTPDVDIANGYEADAKALYRRLKLRQAKKKASNNLHRWSYKDW